MQAVFDTLNAAGGINGHKIDFTVLNDQSSPTVGATVALQAVGMNPTAIMSSTNSTPFAGELPTLTQAGGVVLSNVTVNSFYPWFYSDSVNTKQNINTAIVMAQQILGNSLTGKKIAFAGAISPGVVAVADNLKPALQAAGAILTAVELMAVGAPSYSSGATNIVITNPDLVVVYDTPADALIETLALRTAGYKGIIASNYGAASDVTIQTLADPLWYGEYPAKPVLPGTAMYIAAQKYGLMNTTTTTQFAAGWGLAQMLVSALKKCGFPCSNAKLMTSLDSLGSYTAPGDSQFGPYLINKTTHAVLRYVKFYVWSESKRSVVPYGKVFDVGPSS
jgi:ABC-type branched-subunit amino acid transport system substrate-binding protein